MYSVARLVGSTRAARTVSASRPVIARKSFAVSSQSSLRIQSFASSSSLRLASLPRRLIHTSSPALVKINTPEAEIITEKLESETADFVDTEKIVTEAANTATESAKTVDATPEPTEQRVGATQHQEFKTETRKILDIVARSLYTDKEVFVRELISNASDACEKARHLRMTSEITDPTTPFEINISTNEEESTLIIQDTGIGMNKEELVQNLGNIGFSGSGEFLSQIEGKTAEQASQIIGQFGVGFYSVFMVSNSVTVYSRSGRPGEKGYYWHSDGSGSFDIAEAEGVARGTKIVIKLTPKNKEFAIAATIDRIVKKYSNFVGFDILLNGNKTNTIKALWMMNKREITEKDHKEFYQFIAHAYDEPMYHFQFNVDTPLDIKGLFYVGQQHSEKYGMGRLEPGINLFCKRVLIQPKARGLLPDWMRFVKGVVDSEDIPLNISREHLQDTVIVKRIGHILARRILKWLDEESRRDPKQYNKFFDEFGAFIREGIASDSSYKQETAKLLRYETSHAEPGSYTSLDEYVDRMKEDQKEIYYLCIPTRSLADSSPYFESFKANDFEVLFLYGAVDDFVMTTLGEYSGKKLVSIESANAAPKKSADAEKKDEASKEWVPSFTSWFQEVLKDKVSAVKESSRLVDSPAIIVDHESASFRRMMKYVDPGRSPDLGKQQLEINASHPLMERLNAIREDKPQLAELIVEQVFDNALVQAGLKDDARDMVPRLNEVLLKACGEEKN